MFEGESLRRMRVKGPYGDVFEQIQKCNGLHTTCLATDSRKSVIMMNCTTNRFK